MTRIWTMDTETSCVEAVVGKKSKYRHRVGGSSSHSGLTPLHGVSPIHLVMTLDLSDNRVPFSQPHLTELPLFYAFEYDASSISYQVIDDGTVKIVEQPRGELVEGFPYDNYPSVFPCMPVSLSERIEIGLYFNDSDLQELWEEELGHAISEKRILDDIDRIALIEGLMQGPPRSICGNPACDKQPMKLLTVLRGDLIDGFNFWSNEDDGPEVDLTYEYCPKCYTIHTENQCG